MKYAVDDLNVSHSSTDASFPDGDEAQRSKSQQTRLDQILQSPQRPQGKSRKRRTRSLSTRSKYSPDTQLRMRSKPTRGRSRGAGAMALDDAGPPPEASQDLPGPWASRATAGGEGGGKKKKRKRLVALENGKKRKGGAEGNGIPVPKRKRKAKEDVNKLILPLEQASLADKADTPSPSTSTDSPSLPLLNGHPKPSTNGPHPKRLKRRKSGTIALRTPTAIPKKPGFDRMFLPHPLVAPHSTRSVPGDAGVLIPTILPRYTLLGVTGRNPLVLTQVNAVWVRGWTVIKARLFLRRSLTYSVGHRRFTPLVPSQQRDKTMKKRNVECYVQQLWERKKTAGTVGNGLEVPSRRQPGNCDFPVELEIQSFTVTRTADSKKENDPRCRTRAPPPIYRNPQGDELIRLQIGILRRNPREKLSQAMLPPVLQHAPKREGVVGLNGKVSLGCSRFRLEGWNLNDYLVVSFEAGHLKRPNCCAFNIKDIKEGLNLEVKEQYSMKVAMRKHPPSQHAEVDYVYVLIYPPGESYQVSEMAIVENKRQSGHACLLCTMRCDSLGHLIRHLEGLHPSVGCEYDGELKRLYVWFAPEQEFRREPVVGFMDRWEMVHRHRGEGLVHYREHQPVMQWLGKRFVRPEHRATDALPVFSLRNVQNIYGIPVTPIRHHLHSNTVQPIRPDHKHMVEHDSDDEDNHWQDQYEHDKINDFIDCSPAEKQLMCLWNTFTRPYKPVFSVGLRDLLCRFVERQVEPLEVSDAYAPLCAHLSVLRRLRCVSQEEAMQVVKMYRAVKNCDGFMLEKLKKG